MPRSRKFFVARDDAGRGVTEASPRSPTGDVLPADASVLRRSLDLQPIEAANNENASARLIHRICG